MAPLVKAQLAYTLSASSGSFTANSTVVVFNSSGSVIGTNKDDLLSAAQNIGFTFSYGCNTYTQFLVSSNGFLVLGNPATTSLPTNSLTNNIGPIIAPLWDDLKTATSSSSVNYKQTGIVGSRVMTIEWLNVKWDKSASGGNISFQVKLYEGSNQIDFVYRQDAAGTYNSSSGASIGIGNNTVAGGTYFYSLNNSGTSPTANYGTETTTITTPPATGQVYSWTPYSVVLAQPFTASVGKGGVNEQILKIQIDNNLCSGNSVTQFQVNMTGTTAIADVSKIHIYYSGTTSDYTIASEFVAGGTTAAAGTITINGSQALSQGSNYFYIAYDVKSTATTGNIIDAQVLQATIGGTNYSPTVTAPVGSRTISATPTNDNVCAGTFITPSKGSCTYTTYDNTASTISSTSTPACGNFQGGDIWFKTIAPTCGNLNIATSAATITDGAMAIYKGTCSSLTLISCVAGAGSMPSTNLTGLTNGDSLYIRFWPTYNRTAGTFKMCVYDPNPYYCLLGNAYNLSSTLDNGNCVGLTTNNGGQTSQLWATSKIDLTQPFDYNFDVYLGNNSGGADGITFTIQNDPRGYQATGTSGFSMGAGGITNSLNVEFDTYDNGSGSGDIPSDHIAIDKNGDPTTPLVAAVSAQPSGATIKDGVLHTARIIWNPTTKLLSVYFDGTFRLSMTYDIIGNIGSNTAFWGFTGSTGAYYNYQYICPSNFPGLQYAGEICGNGTDDDGDGLIDCNDPDCVTASLSVPSTTTCPAQSITISQTSSCATSYRWNLCNDFSQQPVIAKTLTNAGMGFQKPVYYKDASGYHVFATSSTSNHLIRFDFGTSLLNAPSATTDLGAISTSLTGLDIQQDGANYYGYAVSNNSLYKLSFGTSLTNAPVVSNLGNIGTMSLPYSMQLVKDPGNGNWYGFVANQGNGTVTRLSFGTSLNNVPTGTSVGGLNSPTSVYVMQSAGNWYGFVTDIGSDALITLDFGFSITNAPTVANTNTFYGMLNNPYGFIIYQEGNTFTGFITNNGGTSLLKVTFNGSPTSTQIGIPINGLTITSPQNMSNVWVDPSTGELYFLVGSSGSSIVLIKFPSCTNSAITTSTTSASSLTTSYNSPGTYTVSFTVNPGTSLENTVYSQVVISSCGENCSNGVDDDGDTFIDCNDPDCVTPNFTGNVTSMSSTTGATVYQDCGYGGYAVALPPGNYTTAEMVSRGISDNDISSIQVTPGYTVIFYQNDNFTGTAVTLTSSTTCLVNADPTLNYNDWISSIKVIAPTSAATVCVGSTLSLTNTSTCATTAAYDMCDLDIYTDPTFTNLGNLGFSLNSYTHVDAAYDGTNYFVFTTRLEDGSIIKSNFGSSYSNAPTSTILTTLAGAANGLEGIRLRKDGSNWYGFAVAGNGLWRLSFGTSLSNAPTVTNLGMASAMNGPRTLEMVQDLNDGNWYAFVANGNDGTITKFSFGSTLANLPTPYNMGTFGFLAKATDFYPIYINNTWYGVVTDYTNHYLLSFSFGTTLSNNNLSYLAGWVLPDNLQENCISFIQDCSNNLVSFIGAANMSYLARINWANATVTAGFSYSYPSTAAFNRPEGFSTLIRDQSTGDYYHFAGNAGNGTIVKIKYTRNCYSAPTYSTSSNPTVSFTQPGTYNVMLTVNQGKITEKQVCKQVSVVSSCGPLPVDLITFKVNPLGKYADITWETANEKNISSYEVERSIDLKNVEAVAKVPSKGMITINEYEILDQVVYHNTTIYYRLKVIEGDGSFKYSDWQSLKLADVDVGIVVYPNPARDQINVSLFGISDNKEIDIYNSLGEVIFHSTEIDGNKFSLSLLNFKPGFYIMKVTDMTTGTDYTKDFIKTGN